MGRVLTVHNYAQWSCSVIPLWVDGSCLILNWMVEIVE